MRAFIYPATVAEPATGDFVVSFPDVPEAITGGSSLEEALANAVEALEVAVEHYLDIGRAVPNPSRVAKGQHAVVLAPSVAARVALTAAMAQAGLSKAGLAARMNRDEKVVRRILSGKSASLDLTLDALEAAGVRTALAFA